MSIQRRTVFYDVINNIVRFHDWATVTTTLGAMMEPHNIQQVHHHDEAVSTPNFDYTDEINRIDKLEQMDSHRFVRLSGEGTIGGNMNPRLGP